MTSKPFSSSHSDDSHSINEDDIRSWLSKVLCQHSDIHASSPLLLTPLSGDAGFRRYFRVNTKPSLLVVQAPHTGSNSDSAPYFAQLSSTLGKLGLPSPQIRACDEQLNLLCLEDFGSHHLLDALTQEPITPEKANTYYQQACQLLLKLQQIPPATIPLDEYNHTELRRELALFPDWFIQQLLGLKLSEDDQDLLDQCFQFLEAKALEQPQVLVHRDFHARNLMVIQEPDSLSLGMIDFQDMLKGPITYDLVSLLRDCYIQWSPQQVRTWSQQYAKRLIELELLPTSAKQQWQGWFDCTGLQRHLKVLGVFSRLSLRDNKTAYLKDLPLVWHYTLEIAQQYPELDSFYQWCQHTLLPQVKQQAWYQKVPDQETPSRRYPYSIYSSR